MDTKGPRLVTRGCPRIPIPPLKLIHDCKETAKAVTLARGESEEPGLTTMPSMIGKSSLVVFDFDHTMISDNSDTYVVEKTSNRVALLMDKLKDAGKRNQWTSGMDDAMGSLHEEGVSVEAIEECMRGITIDPAIKESMQQMAGQGADIRVLSDANTLFIRWILEANGLDKIVTTVVSNPAEIQDGRLRVRPYHVTPHPAGSTSPPNLCKGRVMEEWLKEREWTSCIYCGDGGGDFEGAMKVPAVCGVILARQGWTLDQRLAEASPAAKVKTWTDQECLGNELKGL